LPFKLALETLHGPHLLDDCAFMDGNYWYCGRTLNVLSDEHFSILDRSSSFAFTSQIFIREETRPGLSLLSWSSLPPWNADPRTMHP
jgi:hypothetical protein